MIDLIFNWPNFIVLALGLIAFDVCKDKYEETKSRALLNCIPGIFTSLGLLGTFCAICWSLHGLGDVQTEVIDQTGKTLNEVRKAGGQNPDIMKITSELIPAFTTSIVGLIGALGATVYAKWVFAIEDKKDNKKLKNVSPEEYIRDIAIAMKSLILNRSYFEKNNKLLANLIDLHKEEKEKNREYNDKLNENISSQSKILKEFIDSFVERMDELFKQMNGAIQQQVLNFGEEQFSKTSELLTSITERLTNVSNDIISNQRESVETMLNNTNSEISNITTSVTDVLGNLTKELQNSLSSLRSQQAERLNTIITNYDSLATMLSTKNSDFVKKMTEQMQSEYSKVQEHNVQSLQQMVDLRKAYQETTYEMLTSTKRMNEKATAELRESMSGFVTDIQGSISTQCSALSTAIAKNVKSLNETYDFVKSLVAEIRQNYDQSVLAYGDAVNVAHRTNESSEKAIAANNKSLQAVEETNAKISEVLNLLNKRQENIEQLTKHISSISGSIVELQKLESTLNKIANK